MDWDVVKTFHRIIAFYKFRVIDLPNIVQSCLLIFDYIVYLFIIVHFFYRKKIRNTFSLVQLVF